MAHTVYLEARPGTTYPKTGVHPSTAYPEYPFPGDCVQAEANPVYDMVRQCLIGLGLDASHYGTPQWDPLGRYIRPGDHVVLKPNWVMHFNGARRVKENALECLVTHPACLRAVCDYCLIALHGKGQVIIGDAPMQDCDLPELLEKFRYNDILRFYEQHGQPVRFMDFRKYQSTFDRNSVIVDKIYQSTKGIDVDMGSRSMHEQRQGKRVYQVDNYDRSETGSYHRQDRHVYSVNETVLDADVIINLCKPKSHRLAGFTAAMKNMVGIAYNKASLPHRVEGAASEGGDAYRERSAVKRAIDWLLDRKIAHEDKKQFFLATADRYLYGLLVVVVKKLYKDPYIKGIWYGNDTIWRTVVDLNHIVTYADKCGVLQDTPQRRILHFADMVVAGERNGPCQPEPKPMGVILASESAVAMDLTIGRMIGFPWDKVPLTRALLAHQADALLGDQTSDIWVASNSSALCGRLGDVRFPPEWKCRPHDTWAVVL